MRSALLALMLRFFKDVISYNTENKQQLEGPYMLTTRHP